MVGYNGLAVAVCVWGGGYQFAVALLTLFWFIKRTMKDHNVENTTSRINCAESHP